MANQEIQQKLQQGIAAARSGNRPLGRRLLLQVTQADPKNEQAWIWLASCVTTIRERRYCLEQVVEINPGNEIAQRALQQLEEPDRPAEQSRPRRPATGPLTQQQPAAARRPGRTRTSTLLIYGGLALLLVVLGVVLLLSPEEDATPPQPTATRTVSPDAVLLRATLETYTPTVTNTPAPTNTPILVYNSTSLAPTLPPTFTPAPTDTPEPIIPTATPYPLSEMDALAVGQQLGQTSPNLYQVRGDGSNASPILAGVREVVYDPTGSRVALIIETSPGSAASELHVASADDPSQTQQITSFGTAVVSNPSWSLDGQEIVFVSTANGSQDIWYVPVAEPDRVRPLTNTETVNEREPAWRPLPDSREITFASDADGSGTLELFRMQLPRQGTEPEIEQLTNAAGSTYAPVWSPDGSRLVFISTRRGDPDVYIADPDGGSAFLITFDDGSAEDRNASFTPDGRLVVFSSNRLDDRFQVYSATLNANILTRITSTTTDDLQFAYRPIPGLVER